jgi:DNA-binding NarL/FixJ family response regulator
VTGPIRVLIADEHAGTRAEMREAVEQDGRFTVVAEATDGAAAVQAALSERPDLCLVDIRMLGSGIAATREITARLPETKVVMITASLDEDDLFSALRAGAIGYLHKDIDPDRLPHALNDAVEGGAPISRRLVTRLVAEFRDRGPHRRPVVSEPRLRPHEP